VDFVAPRVLHPEKGREFIKIFKEKPQLAAGQGTASIIPTLGVGRTVNGTVDCFWYRLEIKVILIGFHILKKLHELL
jgi:hypothetical protein